MRNLKQRVTRGLAACAISFALFSMSAFAGVQGKVQDIWLFANNPIFLFTLENTATDHPACASVQRYAIRTDTDAGRAAMSYVLTAIAQDKSLIVYGTGACSIWTGAEDVHWIED